ncbi:MAG TPA: metal ABC transporter permease [Thermoanaerobaculia bacterium]|nr:metal ABC transporter permease [Thermoanaerobaculia bacterium]
MPEFMKLAFAAGLVVGVVAPAVGFFLVERRMSLIGDGIGHTAFAGVALAQLLGLDPVLTALVVSVAGALVMELLHSRGGAVGDQALAFLLYTSMAAAVVLASAARAVNAGLFAYLFGSILTVEPGTVLKMSAAGALVLAVIAALYRRLLAVALDEEAARACGLPVLGLNLLVAVLAALTVALSMRTVGLLLVAALMVLPVLAAGRLARSVRSTLLIAMALGALSAVGGLSLSWVSDLAPGGTIVLVAAGLYLLSLGAGLVRRRVTV